MPRTPNCTAVSGNGQSGSAAHVLPELSVASIFATPLGVWGCLGGPDGLLAVTIGNPSLEAARERLLNQSTICDSAATLSEHPADFPIWFQDCVSGLQRVARGESFDFSEIPVCYPATTPLRQAIWQATRQIPWGETLTYGELAIRAGVPRGARTVGQAMSHNVMPIVIPCHRVVGAGGKLTGFSAPRGVDLKTELLAQESDSVT